MAAHGTVEHFQSFDVHVLHRMGALREPLVSYPMVSFQWPGLVRLTANKWRVDMTVSKRCNPETLGSLESHATSVATDPGSSVSSALF